MKNKKSNENKSSTFIIVAGIIILIVFAFVVAINLLPNYESNSYYVKVNSEMSAKIESISIEDGKLLIKTSGDPIEYCVKSTRTAPSVDSLCWNKVEDNKASISIYEYKKYYIWIKDKDGNISNYVSVNSNDNE